MKPCKTCRFWEREGSEIGGNPTLGSCKCDKFVDADNFGCDEFPHDSLQYWGAYADFSTGGDFGCIHHEKSEDQKVRSK